MTAKPTRPTTPASDVATSSGLQAWRGQMTPRYQNVFGAHQKDLVVHMHRQGFFGVSDEMQRLLKRADELEAEAAAVDQSVAEQRSGINEAVDLLQQIGGAEDKPAVLLKLAKTRLADLEQQVQALSTDDAVEDRMNGRVTALRIAAGDKDVALATPEEPTAPIHARHREQFIQARNLAFAAAKLAAELVTAEQLRAEAETLRDTVRRKAALAERIIQDAIRFFLDLAHLAHNSLMTEHILQQLHLEKVDEDLAKRKTHNQLHHELLQSFPANTVDKRIAALIAGAA